MDRNSNEQMNKLFRYFNVQTEQLFSSKEKDEHENEGIVTKNGVPE